MRRIAVQAPAGNGVFMGKKPSLYEILGIPANADAAEIDRASKSKLQALESPSSAISSSELAAAKQMIRIATSTLSDASSRLAYDDQLARANALAVASSPQAASSKPSFANQNPPRVPAGYTASAAATGDVVGLRAEALALRAEALSLRADAMLMQAGGPVSSMPQPGDGVSRLLANGAMWRIMIFLGLLAAIAFGVSRYIGNAPVRANAAETQAMERAALQEYFQTHGVRPANMAELELLEVERRRRENAQRNEKQDVSQKTQDERKFEEESRRRGEEVAERLRADEARHQATLALEKLEADRMVSERKERERLAEERRLRMERERWERVNQR
jgi:curved DNA-binding protein CbpA